MKRLFHIGALLLLAMSASSCLVGKYMCNYALVTNPHGSDEGEIARTRHKADSLCPGVIAWYDALYNAGTFKDTSIISWNGNKVHAVYAPAANPAKAQGNAVVVHGYGDNHFVFLYLVKMYRDTFNYNVMVPDLQYHGYSEGGNIQMGWYDRFDVEKLTELAHEIWPNDFTVIHGVSMGGATTMMMSGDELPDYVKAFVEDCGYSSVWDQLKSNLKDSFHLPPFPVLTSASIVCKKRYGWSFKEASSVNQLAKCTRPMLFIHGDADDFVPVSHVYKNYEAKTQGYKEMWICPGAVHANSFQKDTEGYISHVKAFLQKVKDM